MGEAARWRSLPLSTVAPGKGAFGPRNERALVCLMSAEVRVGSSSGSPSELPGARQQRSPGPTDPAPRWPQGAEGRGGPRRAGSGRRGEVDLCMVPSGECWTGCERGRGGRKCLGEGGGGRAARAVLPRSRCAVRRGRAFLWSYTFFRHCLHFPEVRHGLIGEQGRRANSPTK